MRPHGRTGSPWLPFDEGGLPRLGRAKRQPSKLFFALKPPDRMARDICRAAARHALNRTRQPAYPAGLLHMTLLCMDAFHAPPRHLIPDIENAVGGISARPVSLALDGSALLGGKRHLALTSMAKNSALEGFVRILRNVLSRHNLPGRPSGSFTPHVTIIYGCGKIEPLPLEQPYAWTADEFLLIYSHYGETRHEQFGRWRFDPDASPYPASPEQLRLMI
ncbi:2'-5' RNA ligase family protein [Rhizobium puerariae]|uniref:2'-5' RNA ligase family protein n=1 Tax=Rhizobium puerariae TaxID=1585791 RepID=A0ABV6AIY8_9HYPH